MNLQDELLWGATWLYIATKRPIYLKFIQDESTTAVVTEFSWDLKFAGAQILLSQVSILTNNKLLGFIIIIICNVMHDVLTQDSFDNGL